MKSIAAAIPLGYVDWIRERYLPANLRSDGRAQGRQPHTLSKRVARQLTSSFQSLMLASSVAMTQPTSYAAPSALPTVQTAVSINPSISLNQTAVPLTAREHAMSVMAALGGAREPTAVQLSAMYRAHAADFKRIQLPRSKE